MEKTKIYVPLNIQRFSLISQSGEFEFPATSTGSYNITFQGKITWASSTNTETNTSTIQAVLHARKQNASTATTGKDWNGNITIDGTPYSFTSLGSSTSIKNDWVLIDQFSRTIQHNNNGTKSIVVSGSITGPSGTSLAKITSSGSQTIDLPRVPRYANVTEFNVSAYDEHSFKITYKTDVPVDIVEYSADGGSYTTLPSSGIVGGFGAYTSHSFKLAVRRADSLEWTHDNTSVTSTTYDYPKPTSSTNFIIGEGAFVNLHNPLNRNCTLELVSNNDGSVIGTYSGTYHGVVNGEFKTQEAIIKQYRSIPNSQSGTYYARVIYDGNERTYQDTNNNTYTINYENSKPVFSHFDFYDINEKTLALTQNNKSIIDKNSTVRVSIVGYEATGYETDIDYYTVNGNRFTSAFDITNFSGTSIKVFAVDKRGNSTYVDLPVTPIYYTNISKGAFDYERSNNGTGTQVTFMFSGSFWNKNFGAVQNSLSIKYKLKKTGATDYGEEKTIDSSLITVDDNGNYYFNQILAGDMSEDNGFDIENSYNVSVTLNDQLSSVTFNYIVIEGSPALDLVGNCVALGGYYDETIDKKIQINDVYFKGNIGNIVAEDINANEIIASDVTCKNLFNFDNLRMDWATIDYVNKTITFGGFNNSTLNTLKDICPDLVVGETYTFSFKTTSEMDFIYLNGSQYTWYNGTSHKITQEELDNYILFYSASDAEHTISNIQIEKGTNATKYVPFKQFKNIFEVDVIFDWANIETNGVYTLKNEKKFSDYKLIEITGNKTSVIKTYSSLRADHGKIFQLIWYENPSSGKTIILSELEYLSDTQFKCLKSCYSGNNNTEFYDNPYPIVIRGIKM